MPRRAPSGWGDLALLVCAAGWGLTFPLTRSALDHASPFALLAVRFLLAGLFLVPLGFARGGRALLPALGWGAVLGGILAAGYMAQNIGLTMIGASRSAFLTAFFVIFTPFLEWLVERRPPSPRLLAGALLALAGALVMTGAAAGQLPSPGDLFTLFCALVYSAHLVALGRALQFQDPRHLLFLQIAFCGLICLAASFLLETPRWEWTALLGAQVLYLSLIGTVVLLSLQNYGQARTSASRAAILFASEPVWAAFFAALFGEKLSLRETAGALCVLAGILVSTLRR